MATEPIREQIVEFPSQKRPHTDISVLLLMGIALGLTVVVFSVSYAIGGFIKDLMMGRVRLRLLATDAAAAEQVGRVVAGWRELVLSRGDSVADGSVAQRLRAALLVQPVRVLDNQVLAEAAVPAGPVLRTGKRVVHYAMVTLPSVAAATNGPSATAARLDKLRRLAKQVPGEGVSGLLPALGDRSPTVRALAAWSLSAAGDPELAHALRPLLDDDAERVRASAAWALGQLRALVAADWLAACVRADPSDLVRYRAVAGLGALGQPAVLPVLLEALGDSAAAVREQAAISALPLLGNGALPKKLSEQACSTKPATRRLALVLIGRSGGDGAEAALRAGLNDPEPVVCAEAILGLGRQRLPLKPDELRRLQAHADEHVRGAVAHALWLRGEQSADVVLRELLQDPHPFVRAVAAEGLGQWGITVVKPPSGFSAAETFSYPF